ncbi:sugar porter family MFS transporter [Legionella sainthelensi]|uniref:sugar porter family MFS transporter n=1 Tax=Legionella sainthelensi TaxID=28087 RepID=UPI000E20B5E6|nr:sugar porter family MFS transporter [Legionella sainthelensi]
MKKANHNYWRICGILSIAICSGLLVGYVTAIIAGALPLLTKHFNLDDLNQGFLVAIILIGGFTGSLICGKVTAPFGHKKALLLMSGIFILGSIWSAMSPNFWSLILARFCAGIAVGMCTVISPMYVAETAPDSLRGFLVGSVQLAITIGILGAYIVSYYFVESKNWPMMFELAVLPALVLFLVTLTQFESPRWLLLNNRIVEANDTFFKLHGYHWTENKKAPHSHNVVSTKALLNPILLPAILFASGLFLFQNLSGIDAILYYAPSIFQQSGFLGLEGGLKIAILVGVINIIATLLSMYLLDSLGRRPVLIYGLFIMAVSLLGFSVSQLLLSEYPFMKWFSLLMLLSFVASFASSMGPIPYVIMSELFPLHLRNTGMGIASATSWGINAFITFAYPLLESHLGISWIFAGFSLICVIACLISIIFCPETQGQSLESIEARLYAGVGLRKIGKS